MTCGTGPGGGPVTASRTSRSSSDFSIHSNKDKLAQYSAPSDSDWHTSATIKSQPVSSLRRLPTFNSESSLMRMPSEDESTNRPDQRPSSLCKWVIATDCPRSIRNSRRCSMSHFPSRSGGGQWNHRWFDVNETHLVPRPFTVWVVSGITRCLRGRYFAPDAPSDLRAPPRMSGIA